ncbi:butyrophilin subfamily 2 member A1-like [Numenius arquata]|uniref:butyrophilin subfamily 2 member A1-like n=1 Tax=Numenius arquata TaxID=31919 RepID=UPI003D3062B7
MPDYSSPPSSSVIGVIGEGVLLPCHVVANNVPEVFSVQWVFHEQSQEITVSRYDGKTEKEKQDERYQGRTEFFHSDFRAGNMSLHLKNIRSSDKGSYTCVVSFNDTYHAMLIDLQVAAKGGVPSIFLRSHEKKGIDVSCHAAGWFPKPEVIWLDSQGRVRNELSTTKMTVMPAGLYSVVTSMNLNPSSDMEVSCRIVNNLLNTTSESRVLISDIFFPYISKWLIIFLVILCLSMVLISTVFYKLRSSHKKTEGVVKVKMEIEEDFWEARSNAVPITVNPECRVLELQVPGVPDVESNASESAGLNTPSTVPVLVGKEGFASGKHYWEVEVGQEQDWVLGVVREKGRQEEEGTHPREDYWALHRSQGEIFSSTGDHRIEKQMSYSVIGVLLDLDRGRVNFYEAEQIRTMVRMPLRLGMEPTETFYPFICKKEGTYTPLIRSVSIPVPLETL